MIPSMKKAILFFLVLLSFRVFAQGDLLQSLDSVLNRRRYYMDIKENRIRRLTQEMKGRDDRHRLTVAGKLFWEYYTYRFASAPSIPRLSKTM